MCIVLLFDEFCLVNNFMIWKRKKEKKKETFNVRIRTRNIWITKLAPYRWATETSYYHSELLQYVTKYVFYIQYGVSDHTTFDLCNPHNSKFDSKNLIKCIIKVVNVSKSQYYEFRHNIMNLGNQNSKYSWRIRDLENPQTGTQFANSVLMYKICDKYYMPVDWNQFLNSTEVLPILRVLERGFQLGVSQFCTNLGLNCLFVIIIVPIFSVDKIIYWVGSFGQWAGLIYLVDKVIY